MLARCLYLRNLLSFDPQKLKFVKPWQMQKLFITTSGLGKRRYKKGDIFMVSLLFIAFFNLRQGVQSSSGHL